MVGKTGAAVQRSYEGADRMTTVDIEYAISLQRAIEYHCHGELVPPVVAKGCPHHAKMLNDVRKQSHIKETP